MEYEEYVTIIKKIPETSHLSYEPAWLWFHRDWLPYAVTSLNGCTEKLIRIPRFALNKYGKNVPVNTFRKNVFRTNKNITDIILHSEVKSIPEGAFEGCVSLERITIPQAIQEIGPYTFNGCVSLKDVYYEGAEEAWREMLKISSSGQ